MFWKQIDFCGIKDHFFWSWGEWTSKGTRAPPGTMGQQSNIRLYESPTFHRLFCGSILLTSRESWWLDWSIYPTLSSSLLLPCQAISLRVSLMLRWWFGHHGRNRSYLHQNSASKGNRRVQARTPIEFRAILLEQGTQWLSWKSYSWPYLPGVILNLFLIWKVPWWAWELWK